jgi:hypothetical protein
MTDIQMMDIRMEVAMKTWARLMAGFAASIILMAGIALAQTNQDKAPDCDRAKIREKLEGQVTKVDPDQGKMTMRDSNGETFEFQASKETLQSYKVGDHIEAKLRTLPTNCKSSGSG